MWEHTIREIRWEDLEYLRLRAKSSPTVGFRDTQNTLWFGIFVDEELVGCASILSIRKNFTAVRFKSGYTLPE